MHIPLRTQLIQKVPWFFQPAFEHLEFLSRDCGFSFDGESLGGPDNYARLVFADEKLEIEVLSWVPMDLPTLAVTRLRPKRRALDLRALAPGYELENGRGDYYERYMRVHPLDKGGRVEVDRQFQEAVARRIGHFAAFLREHLETLKHAA